MVRGSPNGIALRPTRPPSPGLSPINCMGERRIRSRFGGLPRGSLSPQRATPRALSPAATPSSPRRRTSCVCCSEFIRPCRAAPSPPLRGRKGRIRASAAAFASPPLREERAGRGHCRTQLVPFSSRPHPCPPSTSPSSFGGGGRVVRARRGRPADAARSTPPRRPHLPTPPLPRPRAPAWRRWGRERRSARRARRGPPSRRSAPSRRRRPPPARPPP